MVKVVIDIGHLGNDSGAVANGYREDELNKSIGLYATEELRRHGVEVLNTTGSLSKRTTDANNFGANLFVSIHNNAGGGNGTEVLYTSNAGKDLAQIILDEIVNSGLNNSRGVKNRDDLYVLNHTKMPACIVECAFIDSTDIEAIDTEEERKAFGIAIAKGTLKKLGIAYVPPAPTPTTLYKVQVGAFAVKDNAVQLANELKALGYDVIIVEA